MWVLETCNSIKEVREEKERHKGAMPPMGRATPGNTKHEGMSGAHEGLEKCLHSCAETKADNTEERAMSPWGEVGRRGGEEHASGVSAAAAWAAAMNCRPRYSPCNLLRRRQRRVLPALRLPCRLLLPLLWLRQLRAPCLLLNNALSTAGYGCAAAVHAAAPAGGGQAAVHAQHAAQLTQHLLGCGALSWVLAQHAVNQVGNLLQRGGAQRGRAGRGDGAQVWGTRLPGLQASDRA